jgi:hypothetical protein
MKTSYSLLLAGLLLIATSLSKAATGSEPMDFADTTASIFKVDENNAYKDNLALREARKLGLGIATGGSLGTYGLNLEVNFEDVNSAMAGFGGGAGFSTFQVLWKYSFPGDTVAPYTTAGYSRWYNTSGGRSFDHSAILDRVLSDGEKSEGRFAADFLTGSVGLQYTHLNGFMAGASLFAEVVLMDEVNRGILVPTGAAGAAYYF